MKISNRASCNSGLNRVFVFLHKNVVKFLELLQTIFCVNPKSYHKNQILEVEIYLLFVDYQQNVYLSKYRKFSNLYFKV